MRPPLYKRQVRSDLERWTAGGLITADQHSAILADLDKEAARPFSDWLGLFGAILIATGAVTFVAANWEAMPKLARLGILAAALVAAHGLSAILFARGMERMGQASVLLAVGLFGATIMLVGQTYHFNADFPGGIMLWALGALAAAVMVPSRTALGAAFVLGALWTYVQANINPPLVIHWGYVPFWAVCLALSARMGWGIGGHLSMLAAIFWIGRSSPGLELTLGMPFLFASYALLAFALMIWGLSMPGRAGGILTLYMACAFLSLSAADYVAWLHRSPGDGQLSVVMVLLAAVAVLGIVWAVRQRLVRPAEAGILGALTLGLLVAPAIEVALFHVALFWFAVIAVLGLAVSRNWPALTNITVLAFTAGLLATYFQTFGSLIETALLFVVGGVVFVGLSAAVRALTKRIQAQNAVGADGGSAEDTP